MSKESCIFLAILILSIAAITLAVGVLLSSFLARYNFCEATFPNVKQTARSRVIYYSPGNATSSYESCLHDGLPQIIEVQNENGDDGILCSEYVEL